MHKETLGKIVSCILPFALLLFICIIIALVFGSLADRQLEKKAQEQTIEESSTDNSSIDASDAGEGIIESTDNEAGSGATAGGENAVNATAVGENSADEVSVGENAALTEDTSTYSYGVFLDAGPESVDIISKYRTVVIDAQYFDTADIAAIRNGATEKIYSYLNVGSLEKFRDYYFLYDNLTLSDYENWPDERWVDVSSTEWKAFILELAGELAKKGIDGFFVDNCDVCYVYPQDNIYNGLKNILTDLKKTYRMDIIINGGDTFVTRYLENGGKIGDCFDGVNQESVYTCIIWPEEDADIGTDADAGTDAGIDADTGTDADTCSFSVAEDEDREYFTEYLETVFSGGGDVYVIEYTDDEEIAEDAKRYADENGWTIYIAENTDLSAEILQNLNDRLQDGSANGSTDTDVNVTDANATDANATDFYTTNVYATDSVMVDIYIDNWLETHTLEDKIAQLFIVTPEAITTSGKTVTKSTKELKKAMAKYPVGGYIFFSSNLVDRAQTTTLLSAIESVYETNGDAAPFLAVDEEGGLVSRIGNNPAFDVDSTVAMSEIGATGDSESAYEVGSYIGSYLKEIGFNMNMAPDADVLSNADNTVIGSRSFGSDSQLVADMVIAESDALREQGISFAIKHFPGHGGTIGDSHDGYAYTDKTLDELMECELVPFSEGIENGISIIMVGHISVPNVTGDEVPSSLSHYMITDLLRGELGFDGIVITDAMNMGAVTEQYSSAEATILALQAGADIILMPENFVESYNGVLSAVKNGTISEDRIDESVRRILLEKIKNGIL